MQSCCYSGCSKLSSAAPISVGQFLSRLQIDVIVQRMGLEIEITLEQLRVLWDVAQCSHVEMGRRFRGAYCLHHQGDEYST
jgi:hypothetical protein